MIWAIFAPISKFIRMFFFLWQVCKDVHEIRTFLLIRILKFYLLNYSDYCRKTAILILRINLLFKDGKPREMYEL